MNDIEETVSRASHYGGNLISESVANGQKIAKLTGPENLNIILVESITTSESLSLRLLNMLQQQRPTLISTSNPVKTKWNPPRGPIIPTLFPRLYHQHNFEMIYPNSSEPTRFKTDLFEGTMLLLIRTIPMEQRYRHVFLKGSTCFEVQVQGKFLRKPTGRLFIGAEITKNMNLGIITRGICGSILQFVRSINPFIHHSFGDSNNLELPHITGPLWCMSDRIVVTLPGETPPPLGQILPENEAKRTLRRGNPSYEEDINLEATYSFSTNTENIELCDWAMVNVPLMKKFDLHTFWSDADIRLCAYCVPPSENMETEKRNGMDLPKYHYQASNEYMLCVELQHLSNHPERPPNSERIMDMTERESTSPFPEDIGERGRVRGGVAYEVQSNLDQSDVDLFNDDELIFYDAEEGHDTDLNLSERSETNSLSFSQIPKSGRQPLFSESGLGTSELLIAAREIRLSQSSDFLFVPAVISVDDRRKFIGMTRDLYVICIPRAYLSPEVSTISSASPFVVALCSFKEFESAFSIYESFFTQSTARMSKTERRRVNLQESVQQLCTQSMTNPQLRQSLLNYLSTNTHKVQFLQNKPNQSRSTSRSLLMDGIVCTRQGQTHWCEEYLCLNETELIFMKPSSKSDRITILLKDILDIKSLDSRYWPFVLDQCHFFLISTLPKEFTVMVRGEKSLNDWITTLTSARNYITKSSRYTEFPSGSSSSRASSEEKFGETFKQLISMPLDWKLGERVILNGRCCCGRLIFERFVEYNLDSTSHLFPIQLLERCLTLIFDSSLAYLNGDAGSGAGIVPVAGVGPGIILQQQGQWIEFLTLISYLPCIDLLSYNYSEIELTCLFINLYHVMILHTFIVAGPPSTLLRWPSFFTSYSYEAYGDIFSLSELEHCIIKGGLEPPNSLIAQVLIPQSVYDFGLKKKDYRLLWALNCGSMSMPSTVPILIPAKCEEQLDRMIRDSIATQLQISVPSSSTTVIILPQVCQYYFSLLVESSPIKNRGTISVLQLLADYASPSQRNILRNLLFSKEKVSYTVKYEGIDFRCRFFTRNAS